MNLTKSRFPVESQNPKPIFKIGDRVCYTSRERDFSVVGTVSQVIKSEEFNDIIDKAKQYAPEEVVEEIIENYRSRDSEFDSLPAYVVIPDGHIGIATFEQAKAIVPNLSKIQYDRLMGIEERYFFVLESDIIHLEWIQDDKQS